MNTFIAKLFCRSVLFRRLIIRFYSCIEGGVFRSSTIRQLYSTYMGINVGYMSYGFTSDYFFGPAIIGKYTSIGNNVRRRPVNHLINYATTHPCVFNPKLGWVDHDPRKKNQIIIGNDVWIGDNVTILPSCSSIGNGAIIGAGAVVSKNIPSYEIWGGVPARFIKKRFTDDISKALESTKWWDYSEEKLKSLDCFHDPRKLIETLQNKD